MDETMFFFITSWVFSIASGGLLVAWLSARNRARRAETYLAEALRPDQGMRPTVDEHVLSEIESLRVEVERLAEGNRFMARVLAERATPEISPRVQSGRVNTPH